MRSMQLFVEQYLVRAFACAQGVMSQGKAGVAVNVYYLTHEDIEGADLHLTNEL